MGLFGKKRAAGSGVAVGEGAFAGAALFGAADSLASGGALSDVEFRHVCKAYGANEVLRRVTFTLPGGGVRCLMAPSGSGKTTLFRVLLGLEHADSGEIRGISPGRISMMFQEDRLCETLTPVENVALVLPPDTRRPDVAALLAEILPADCLSQSAMELSGGMRRRVSLARAVAFPSDLIVLDEPFTGLDQATKENVIAFVLRHRAGRTLLVATHGEDDARLLGADRINLADVQDGGADAAAGFAWPQAAV
ncbi:MAG: ATP-binding cassette domain-containing protein [Coriobacteriia bacterium]|nr:ATP-binding cassette domain-containing protein [Coriobacteriia bacterium]